MCMDVHVLQYTFVILCARKAIKLGWCILISWRSVCETAMINIIHIHLHCTVSIWQSGTKWKSLGSLKSLSQNDGNGYQWHPVASFGPRTQHLAEIHQLCETAISLSSKMLYGHMFLFAMFCAYLNAYTCVYANLCSSIIHPHACQRKDQPWPTSTTASTT